MIDEKYLAILRCPIDPLRVAKLVIDDIKVVCERCRVQFKAREGFLSMIAEEAVLPANCHQISDLPCQKGKE